MTHANLPETRDPDVTAIIERAVAHHGGWDRWRRLARIELQLDTLGGPIPWAKGLGKTWPRPGRVDVMPRRQQVRFIDWPAAGSDVLYDAGRVHIDSADGPPPDATGCRQATRSRGALRRWTPMHAAYFFGAALSTYYGVPFILPEAEVLGRVEHGSGDRRHDVLTVRFPADFHTHGPVQRFWFAADGCLVRHDYHAGVLGPGAWGAHFSRDYVTLDGWPLARTRDVRLGVGWFPRVAASPMPVLQARLTPLAVHFEG